MEREISELKRQLMSLNRPKKPKMLVVDDEPDNLDLLYRTFRRDFSVFRADSGVRALEVLEAEGEVAVIISDQRMPEMKGTEFLSKTVPQFPNTVRIILTGFTDIEDLVEAINSGQVYKYITKPWDPNELKVVVQRAAETYELLNQRTAELQRSRGQTKLLETLMQTTQSGANAQNIFESLAQAVCSALRADGCILQQVKANTLGTLQGAYSSFGTLTNWLAGDPLAKAALSSQTLQAVLNIPNDKTLAGVDHYQTSGVQAHICTPVMYQQQIIALLSLQWQNPCQLEPEDLETINLATQEIALVLQCCGS
ncbi:MAG: response regulator [Oscillatoriales cyanobacterium RM2_1_1]|nr:response regulator [Oscillatoriales cyanobacterium SM2_3_0]NJO47837.1 response regulator [Oscillatoriales cyanobacterium RM2_1_1]